jgi:hypothetical protein
MKHEAILLVDRNMLGEMHVVRCGDEEYLTGDELEKYTQRFAEAHPNLIYFYHPADDLDWLGEYQTRGQEALDMAIAMSKPPAPPTWQEKLIARIMCPACFLPLFVPGHKFRGCKG